MTPRLRGGLALIALSLTSTLLGCSSDEAPSGTDRAASEQTSVEAAAASQQPEDEPDVKRTRLADPLAPATIEPVKRPGAAEKPRLSATEEIADLSDPQASVEYQDGVSLQITSVEQGQTTAKGPGEILGANSIFSIRLTNGSDETLNLDSVVVTAVYGEPRRIARPVYGDEEKDLFARVKSGMATDGVYAFAIPVPDLDEVTIHVDFDNTHTAAVFTGDAR